MFNIKEGRYIVFISLSMAAILCDFVVVVAVVRRRPRATMLALLHLFWQCKVTSLFWGTFFQWLQSCSLIQKGSHLVMTTALGLKPDSSNTKLQINFSCLMSRYYIWKCKLRDEIPNLPQFFRLLKKTYEIETNELNLQSEKWKLLLGHLN